MTGVRARVGHAGAVVPFGTVFWKDGNGPRHQSVVRVARQAGVHCSTAARIGTQNRRRFDGDARGIVLVPAPRKKHGDLKDANHPHVAQKVQTTLKRLR